MTAKAPDIPKKFRLGPYHFQIKETTVPGKERGEDGDPANDGYTDLGRGIVHVRQGLLPYKKALVLHHECGHAIRYVLGGTEVEDEEKSEEHNVNIYSTGYIMLEQENPSLSEYFGYYLRNKR